MPAKPEKQGKSKQCTKCGQTKPLTGFHKRKGRKDGVVADCKDCRNAAQAKWRAENPEHQPKYCKDNLDKFRAYNQRYRARKRNAQGTFTDADWKAKLEYYGYRCRYCGIHKSETNEGWLEADHAIPLSRGGANWISNIVPACKSCNCSKGTKTFKEFLNAKKEI